MKVWINGQLTTPELASVSVLDHGLLYGDGVFEGMRICAGHVLDLDQHLARLDASARAIELQIGCTRDDLAEIVLATAAANASAESYVRLVVTRGTGLLGVDPSSCAQATVFCIVGTLQLYPKARSDAGIALATVSFRRPDPDILDPRVKSLNYLNNVLTKVAARRSGADEALVLNRRGLVAEASGANVFVRRADTLLTPPGTDGALEGITRARVVRLAPELGLHVREQSLSRYDVLTADEVFLTGSGAGLVPVSSLDGQSLPRGTLCETLAARTRQYAIQYGTKIPGLTEIVAPAS